MTGADLVLYGGLAALGLGLLGVLVVLAVPRSEQVSPAERVGAYTARTSGLATASEAGAEGAPAPDRFASSKATAQRVLEGRPGLEARISARLEAAGSSLKAHEWLLVHAGVFVGTTLLVLLLSGGNPLLVLLALVLGVAGPWVVLGLKVSRRRKKFDTALPDTLQLISGSLSAGLSLMQSVDTIVREGVEPMVSEFRRAIVETRLGVDLEDALDGVAQRVGSKDFGWVVMAVRIQREVGGNLAELLDTVAATMRERQYLRRQVASLSAEGRLSAYVLGGLPPVFLLYLAVTNYDYIEPLFTDPRGWIMLGVATLLLVVGFFWMTKMVKMEV
ncbi:type II secretion system F family protein [Nocardioides sp. CFH 31398]|uniref:type II secretion system F family protein n=1 Tax=Nocardioides sp. CFH 31398 TaxID=2919579 RepID=UPI001F06895E|nr:type II secretion system F family protein [Nocardioides sp. CFH 31398]MCH1868223.1 type II secretion system F family protein [Nocardioides sp. CFH 31398]